MNNYSTDNDLQPAEEMKIFDSHWYVVYLDGEPVGQMYGSGLKDYAERYPNRVTARTNTVFGTIDR